MPFNGENRVFIEDIINGMYDWVRVIDRNDYVLFMNKPMCESLGLPSHPGIKCYEAIGRKSPCENCVSRQASFDGAMHEKEETINGRVYSVMSSPVKNSSGDITSVVEVLRDITEQKEMHNKIIEQKEKLLDDLSIARKLQCSLLPKKLPEDRLAFSYIYKPCESIGGDFIDIFKIDKNHTGIYIADVSGHGVSASMLTVFLRSSMDKTLHSPAKALEKLFLDYGKGNFENDLYITVFYAIINFHEKKITFSNAGHNVAPILFNKDKFNLLRTPGIPISNWLDQPGYTDKSLTLEAGDRIFLYTDGIIEIRNPKGGIFGEERLLSHLLGNDSAPNTILNEIFMRALEFSEETDASKISDDITIALLEIKE
ncbi:MAG TPA: SpoIIE family protein phosphatase [Clostridia bacterium]|nr:SpoIIE family protein phosphatase [Clostridia bacterium]